MVRGFQALVPPDDLIHFNATELHMIFAGSDCIDVDDVLRDAVLQGGFECENDYPHDGTGPGLGPGPGPVRTQEPNQDISSSSSSSSSVVLSGCRSLVWLRAVLSEMDQHTLSRFLSFVTGCANMPVEG